MGACFLALLLAARHVLTGADRPAALRAKTPKCCCCCCCVPLCFKTTLSSLYFIFIHIIIALSVYQYTSYVQLPVPVRTCRRSAGLENSRNAGYVPGHICTHVVVVVVVDDARCISHSVHGRTMGRCVQYGVAPGERMDARLRQCFTLPAIYIRFLIVDRGKRLVVRVDVVFRKETAGEKAGGR